MAPTPGGTASCMYWPRLRTMRRASANCRLPAATSAEYSPRLWPATNCGAIPSCVSTASAAICNRPGAACSARFACIHRREQLHRRRRELVLNRDEQVHAAADFGPRGERDLAAVESLHDGVLRAGGGARRPIGRGDRFAQTIGGERLHRDHPRTAADV